LGSSEGSERSLVAPLVVWDDVSFSRAPHHIAAAAIATYVESKRSCRFLRGCEHVVGLGIAYWPFYISRRPDGRLVVVDLLGLHTFRLQILEPQKIAEIASFAKAASNVGATHVNEFAKKITTMFVESIKSKVVEFKGLICNADALEQLVLIAYDGKPRNECVMKASMSEEEAEKTLLKLDVLCENLLEEYRMLENLYETITATIARMDTSIHEEMRRVVSEYTKAVRAIQARIDARMAGVRSEIAREVEEVWERYSRRLGEISARLDTAKRMGSEEEAQKLEKMLMRVRKEYEKETRSIERRYNHFVAGEVRELETLEREKEEKLATLRGELDTLHKHASRILLRLSSLLDQLIEIRSRLCSASTISPYVVESDRTKLYVPVIVAKFEPTKYIIVPLLAVSPEPGDPTPIRPLFAARSLVERLKDDRERRWSLAVSDACLINGKGFMRLVRDGLEELKRRRIVSAEVAERVLGGVERFWRFKN
jgi:hypothetical protein